MFNNLKGIDKIEQPLPHRPHVLVIYKSDGLRKVIGDGDPLTNEEFLAVHELVEPERVEPDYTEQEREAVAGAAILLDQARSAAEAVWDEIEDLRAAHRDVVNRVEEIAIQRDLIAALDKLDTRQGLVQEARIALSSARRNADQGARLRNPPQLANVEERSLAQKIDENSR